MNTETQAEALWLADQLDEVPENGADPDLIERSSAELRRLHAENQQLRADLEAIGAGGVGPLMQAVNSTKIPEGWKLVPVMPTIPMLHRADVLTCIDFAALGREGAFDLDELKEIYRAMLDAAPQPPETARS